MEKVIYQVDNSVEVLTYEPQPIEDNVKHFISFLNKHVQRAIAPRGAKFRRARKHSRAMRKHQRANG